ncbi:MAG: alkaline phosphatase family protein [Phototrophicaceae bacterium]
MFRLFNRRNQAQRVLLLGLDCASPSLIFEQFKDSLPTLSALMDKGTWGVLKSSTPCITVPAWSSMTSSRDPGVLGIYGFRNRADYDYDSLYVADGRAVKEKRIWDYVGEADKQSLVMNVPQTYPVKAINGHLVSGFLTPNDKAQFAFPAIFKNEILKQVPEYDFDVRDFRNVERSELYQQIIDVTNAQYRLLEYALKNKQWDFAMQVNIGVDRMHHAFWRYHDPEHRLHDPDSPFNTAIFDYYQLVDGWLGRLISVAGDDTAIIVASDHGVKRMDGAIAINEWLWQNGWLALKETPQSVVKFTHDMVDWEHTRAWSTGGYYGRIFMNVAGREPQGIIPVEDYETVRDDLAQQIRAIPDDKGQSLDTTVYKPQEIYEAVNRIAPDLLVYFGDLHWRCAGTIGYGRHYTLENDTGPDDANHAQEGMFIIHNPQKSGKGQVNPYQLMDIAPTVLSLMDIDIPSQMQGRVIET